MNHRRLRSGSAAVLLAIAFVLTPGVAAQASRAAKRKPRSGPQWNTGAVDLDLAKEPELLWKYAPEGSRFADVCAFGGMVIALDRKGAIHGLDAKTGKKRWLHRTGSVFSYGYGMTVTRDPEFDVVLVGCDSGLLALHRDTGKVAWRNKLPSGVSGPTCTRDSVIVGCSDGKVYCCDLRSGKIRWEHDYVEDRPEDPEGFAGNSARFDGKEARPRTASTDGKTVFLSVFDQCRTLAIDVETGKRRWAFRTKGWMYGQPTVGHREAYVVSQDGHLYAVDKKSGELVWKVKARARNEAPAALAAKLVLFGSCDGNLYAVDRALGDVVWKFETDKNGRRGAPIYAQPIVSKGTVYLAAMRGKVYAIDLAAGKLRWKFEPLADSELNCDPKVDGGRMFVTTRRNGKKGESAVLAIGAR